jgi:hypothetical protein
MLALINSLDLDLLPGRYHLVFEIPARATSKLGNDNVAVAQKVDVEFYVMDRLVVLAAICGV